MNINSGHYHEILDRAYLILDMFDRFISDSEAVKQHPGLKEKAESISDALGSLYGVAGQALYQQEDLEDLVQIYKKAWK